MNFKFITTAINWVKNLVGKSKDWMIIGNKIANQIKDVADSPILDVIVNLTPTDLDNKLLPAFRKIMADFIKSIGAANIILNRVEDDDAFVSLMHVINAKATKTAGELNGSIISIQQALTSPQIVYDQRKVLQSL